MPELVSDFVKLMKPFFSARGFTRTGLTYRSRRGENYVVIQLQSSVSSTRQAAKVTVNLGIWNRRVATFDDPEPGAKRELTFEACHWSTRLGNLRTPPRDEWWTIDGSPRDAIERTAIEDLLVEKALPELERLSVDRALCDLWLSGQAPGRTAFQRLYDLSILLAQIGPLDRLPGVLRELGEATRRGGMAFSVSNHERRLHGVELSG